MRSSAFPERHSHILPPVTLAKARVPLLLRTAGEERDPRFCGDDGNKARDGDRF